MTKQSAKVEIEYVDQRNKAMCAAGVVVCNQVVKTAPVADFLRRPKTLTHLAVSSSSRGELLGTKLGTVDLL
jgi:hypothetical protein